jgi:DNA-binding NarL/FixJ family response regulator
MRSFPTPDGPPFKAGGPAASNGALSALVVDPRAETRLRVVRVLTRCGRVAIGAASNAPEALELVERDRPGMVLIAANLPGGSGNELAAQLLRTAPELGIFIYGDDAGIDALETALQASLPGTTGAPRAPRKGGALSPRERQVLQLLSDGFSGTEIAAVLRLSRDTVQTHLRNAMRKLGARTRTRAVVSALASGEIEVRAQVAAPPRPVSNGV